MSMSAFLREIYDGARSQGPILGASGGGGGPGP